MHDDRLELYILLFTDSFVSNFAFNTDTEFVIHSMKLFGHYEPLAIVVIAAVAFSIVSMINYLLGRICYNILAPSKQGEKEKHNRIEYIKNSKFMFLILPFTAIPFFGKFLVLFAGFCNVRFYKVVVYASVAKFIYYSYIIYY